MKSFKFILFWMLVGILVFTILSFGLASVKEYMTPEHLKHDMYSMFRNMFAGGSAVLGAFFGLLLAIYKLVIPAFTKEVSVFSAVTILFFLVFSCLFFM
ncbi:hypothetical protein [Maribacter sp.]|uniref:hypothetical protein n=1 Tax=Maribacter sp. TaxID=1897614 RepID=UPI0025C19577|nr:hypothetical protein [Maribacter sp.]